MQVVTWSELIQFGIFVVTLIGLVYQIVRKNKK